MKALAATARTQGDESWDFSFTVPGELVYLGLICGRDEYDPDGPNACGCAKAFIGLNSGMATTTAEVREIPLSAEDFREAVRSSLEQSGWAALGADPGDFVTELAEIAADYPVGTVLGRRIDDLIVRTQG
ncbi:DUF7715 family protein [Actinoplanes sp. CA-142083]|uniref:DUF7715 family protein n=1 Tax=Actinoplanes sp. CA-142083 TaxID=3239903 RepID=UPI003D89C194